LVKLDDPATVDGVLVNPAGDVVVAVNMDGVDFDVIVDVVVVVDVNVEVIDRDGVTICVDVFNDFVCIAGVDLTVDVAVVNGAIGVAVVVVIVEFFTVGNNRTFDAFGLTTVVTVVGCIGIALGLTS